MRKILFLRLSAIYLKIIKDKIFRGIHFYSISILYISLTCIESDLFNMGIINFTNLPMTTKAVSKTIFFYPEAVITLQNLYHVTNIRINLSLQMVIAKVVWYLFHYFKFSLPYKLNIKPNKNEA